MCFYGIEQAEACLLKSQYDAHLFFRHESISILENEGLYPSQEIKKLAEEHYLKYLVFYDNQFKCPYRSRSFVVREGVARLVVPIQIVLILIQTVVSQVFISLSAFLRGVVHGDSRLIEYAVDTLSALLIQSIALPLICLVSIFSPKRALQLCTYRHQIESNQERKLQWHYEEFRSPVLDRIIAAALALSMIPIVAFRLVIHCIVKLLYFSKKEVQNAALLIMKIFYEVTFLFREAFKALNCCKDEEPSKIYSAAYWHITYHPIPEPYKALSTKKLFIPLFDTIIAP